MQGVHRLFPVGLADILQIITPIRRPTPHQVIAPKQQNPRRIRHLAQDAQIRCFVDLGVHGLGILRVDQDQIRPFGTHTRDAGFQGLAKFIGRDAPHRIDGSGLP